MAEAVLDMDKITPRMMIEFKEKTGRDLMSLADSAGELDVADMDTEVLVGVIWVALRTSGQPDATWDDALDTPLTSLDFGTDDEPDPTTAS